jgi:hypothetical protein
MKMIEHSKKWTKGKRKQSAIGRQELGIDVGGAVTRVVMLFPALLLVAVSLIKTDGRSVLGIHMKPDGEGRGILGGFFEAREEFTGYAATAVFGRDFKGLDVGVTIITATGPLHDGKTGHLPGFLGDPGSRFGIVDHAAHIGAREAERRLETEFLDGIERGEVGGDVESIVHG